MARSPSQIADRASQIPRFIAYLEFLASTNQPAPTNDQICTRMGYQSGATAARIVKQAEDRGLITVRRGSGAREIAIVKTGHLLKDANGRDIKAPHFSFGRKRNGEAFA